MITLQHARIMATGILFAIAIIFAASPHAFSQTQLIAHRSHGGGDESFRTAHEDGFGLSPEREYQMSKKGLPLWSVDTVIRLSDTTTIEIGSGKMGVGIGRRTRDTLNEDHYWNNPHITIDSLHRLFPGIIFVGFEEPKKHADNGVNSERGSSVAEGDKPGERRGLMLMALCGAIVVPALAYGLRRS